MSQRSLSAGQTPTSLRRTVASVFGEQVQKIEVGEDRAYVGIMCDLKCTSAPRIRVVVYAGYEVSGEVDNTENGIALFDEETRRVILDRHMKEPTGFFGPTSRQIEEANNIVAMAREDLKLFVDSHPRSRLKGEVLGL